MAEAMGLAASVIALAETTRRTIRYLQGVKNACADSQNILREVINVSVLLTNLETKAQDRLEEKWAYSMKLLADDVFVDLSRLMSELISKLEGRSPHQHLGISMRDPENASDSLTDNFFSRMKCRLFMSSKYRKLTWPFTSVETEGMLAKIERYKSLLQLGLANDQLSLSQEIQSNVKHVKADVQRVLSEIKGMQHNQQSLKIQATEIKESVVDIRKFTRTQSWVVQKQIEIEMSQTQPIRAGNTDIHKASRNQEIQFWDDYCQRLSQWLSPLNFWSKQTDTFSRWQEGTGSWLLENAQFQEWLRGSRQTLYCPGIPGSGKTVLASMVINHIETTLGSQKDIGLMFAYCNYKEQTQQTALNLVSSMMKQLVTRSWLLTDELMEMFTKHSNTQTRLPIRECIQLLKAQVARYSRVYIVIDALDECGEKDSLMLAIHGIIREAKNASLLVTSREIGNLWELFRDTARVEIRASDTDIRTFLRSQLEKKPRLQVHFKKDPELLPFVIDTIASKANGMFLLAQLHMDTVAAKHSLKQIREALTSLPDGLTATYDVAMERIQAQVKEDFDLANNVLTWVTCAIRPLTVQELQHALAVEIDSNSLDREGIFEAESLVNVCAGLVAVDGESNQIRLVHYTAQEYFNRNVNRFFPDANIRIANTCITYLSFDEFSTGCCTSVEDLNKRLEDNPLLTYASHYWGKHARLGSELLLQSKINQFLNTEANVSAALQAVRQGMYDSDYATEENNIKTFNYQSENRIFVAAFAGLGSTVEWEISNSGAEMDCNIRDSVGRSILSLAAETGSEQVCSLLLSRPEIEADSKDDNGKTPLGWAAEDGQEEIVRLLLARPDVDPDHKDLEGKTPL
ncbi:hypothetical protein BDZ91DRAFT_684166, partial [Kalaharituber pfeilii]